MTVSRVKRRVLATHRGTIEAAIDAGRAVTRDWPEPTVSDSEAITAPLRRRLAETGTDETLIELLGTGAAAAGTTIAGEPVAAPPYLAVTGRGPVCRATLTDGRRLVLTVALFAIERRPVRYRFLDPDPAESLEVRVR